MISSFSLRCRAVLCLACAFLSLGAQERLQHPLRFASADSVLIWSTDGSDLTAMALAIDKQLQAKSVVAARTTDKAWRNELKAWRTRLRPTLNLAGGSGDEASTPQTMAAAGVLNAASRLFLLTGEAEYAEAMERSLFNALTAEALRPGELSLEKHVAAQALLDGATRVYACDDADTTIYVNLYINNSARLRAGGLDLALEQLTSMPNSGRVKIRIGGLRQGEARLKLKLRIPLWASGRPYPEEAFATEGEAEALPAVHVNGRELLRYDMERGYLVIDRRWNNGDEVFFDLPMTPLVLRHKHGGKAVRGAVALQRGPLLYALPGGMPDGCFFSAGSPLPEVETDDDESSIALQGSLFREAGTPADAPAPEIPVLFRPYRDTRATVWLREAR